MKNIKEGDIITFIGEELEPKTYKREVLGVCGKIAFTREVFDDGAVGSPHFTEIEYLESLGWKLD